jgi:hypothetical protein
MTPAEIRYRVGQACRARYESLGFGRAKPGKPSADLGAGWVVQLPVAVDRERYVGAADRILRGCFDVFSLKGVALGFPPQWNRDPLSGVVAPLVFGKNVNHHDQHVVGDIKYLWEPNRHGEVVTLAQAWRLTKACEYREGIYELIDSWIDQCPYPKGPNWSSALELGVRLANWAVAWHLLDRRLGAIEARFLKVVYQQCHYISGHLSRYSSANNHLLGEAMGLFLAACTWPKWPESARWRREAAALFEREALIQNATDGVNREQAIWYHHEVADMMLLVGLFGRANGSPFSAEYWLRLETMLDFIAALMDMGGNVPMIGDSDDARLIRWMPGVEWPVHRSLLATGAVVFNRADFAAKAGHFDDKSRWLLGDGAARVFETLLGAAPRPQWPRAFPAGGYYVLGAELETTAELRVIADAGPLGYLSIAAHGHADALAFTLSVGGEELLIDPGTYSYHVEKKWRDYFRGTSAHNTVRVDGLDQSTIAGSFMWRDHAHARCEEWAPGEAEERWVGVHLGYCRLADPVVHRRTIRLEKGIRRVTVTDELDCIGRHAVETFWHFGESCEVSLRENVVHARSKRVVLEIRVPEASSLRLASGEEHPPLGWVSRGYGVKMPTVTAVVSTPILGSWKGETVVNVAIGGG